MNILTAVNSTVFLSELVIQAVTKLRFIYSISHKMVNWQWRWRLRGIRSDSSFKEWINVMVPADSSPSLCRLLNVLEVIAPFKHFNKLREFVQMKLPPGFPVKLGTCAMPPWARRRRPRGLNAFSLPLADIPVFPTITATVTFQEFRYDQFEESTFVIPAEYKEDPSRFPDLWPVNTSDTNRKWPAGLERIPVSFHYIICF